MATPADITITAIQIAVEVAREWDAYLRARRTALSNRMGPVAEAMRSLLACRGGEYEIRIGDRTIVLSSKWALRETLVDLAVAHGETEVLNAIATEARAFTSDLESRPRDAIGVVVTPDGPIASDTGY